MSTYRADSEVSRFNRHKSREPLPVSEASYAVLAAAQEISAATGGAFDITVGPLVDAWGFGPAEAAAPPSEETVRKLAESTGWQKLALDPRGPSIAGDTIAAREMRRRERLVEEFLLFELRLAHFGKGCLGMHRAAHLEPNHRILGSEMPDISNPTGKRPAWRGLGHDLH